MSRRKLVAFVIGAVAIASLGTLATVFAGGAPPATRAEQNAAAIADVATVGDFAVHLATALQLPGSKGGFTAESASAALWEVGIKMRPTFGKSLTESDVTDVLSQMGYSLYSEDPGRAVSTSRASTIVSTFVNSATSERLRQGKGRLLVAGGGNGGDDFNNGNGKGGKFKRKGHQSPSGTAESDFQ